MTIDGHELKGPSIAELQRFIREKLQIEFMLTNGDHMVGSLQWFDEHAFSIVPNGQKPITIMKMAVLAYRPSENT